MSPRRRGQEGLCPEPPRLVPSVDGALAARAWQRVYLHFTAYLIHGLVQTRKRRPKVVVAPARRTRVGGQKEVERGCPTAPTRSAAMPCTVGVVNPSRRMPRESRSSDASCASTRRWLGPPVTSSRPPCQGASGQPRAGPARRSTASRPGPARPVPAPGAVACQRPLRCAVPGEGVRLVPLALCLLCALARRRVDGPPSTLLTTLINPLPLINRPPPASPAARRARAPPPP